MAEEAGSAVPAEEGQKKRSSVKLVRRVKSKKSERGERPELAAPPATIEEQAGGREAPESVAAAQVPAPAAEQVQEQAPVSAQPAEQPRRLSSKRRLQRSGSNVFSMFTQNQVHQFKEAFGFIDQDKDGIISKWDIRATFDALGRQCSDKELEEMASEAPGPINFTMFLTVFGSRVQGTDEEDTVLNAFNQYDEGDGFCAEEK